MRESFISKLTELAEQNDKIVLITADLGFRVMDEFIDRVPGQFINAGVAEQNMTGLATGLAMEGRIVFTYSIANFSTLRCLEHIRNDVCYHNMNVNIVAVGGGLSYGQLGISHHATEDLSIMRALPNLMVVAPSSKWEAGEATEALVCTPGPAYLRLDHSTSRSESRNLDGFELGKAIQVLEGTDLTLVATGGILGEVIQAADFLQKEGVYPRVINMHTLSPLDENSLISAASETGGVVTVEENTVSGGLGGAVAEVLMESGVQPRFFHRVGLRTGFSSLVGSQEYLRKQYELNSASIVSVVLSLLDRVGDSRMYNITTGTYRDVNDELVID